jgi:hypothetical protein
MRAVLVLVAVSGCGAAVPALPGKGGPAWTELQSEHFTMWTDAPVARGRELIREMEHLHQVVFGVAFPALPTAGKSFVLALRDRYEVNAYVPEQFEAFSWPGGNPLRQPVIVFPADVDEKNDHVIAHELTHVISHVIIHDQPPWFAEGIAEFFETVTLDADRAVVDVGEPRKQQVSEVRHLSLVPGDALFGCKKLDCRDERFYMTAGLLFAYLANAHPTELVRFEELLAKGDEHAWATTFPQLTAGTLDAQLRAWALQGSHRVWHFTTKLEQPKLVERTLADGDVLAVRALLAYSFHAGEPNPAEATALAADPTNVITNLIAYDRTHAIDVATARGIAAAHPDDWRSWFLLAIALRTGDEAEAAHAKACTLAATNPANNVGGFCSAHALDEKTGTSEHGRQPALPQ